MITLMENVDNPYGIDEAELKLQRKCNSLEKILESETDRRAAILGAAYIDERLAEIILNYLRDSKVTKNLLDKQIQSLDARTSLAFALGLINQDEYEGINQIRKIRNQFAHDFLEDLSFEDKVISSQCGNLFYDDHFWV
jgi:predicted membrane chloride channel (bestrophin family)